MVSTDFVTFFATMAGVGATLFGLIFLVISIRPEVTRTEHPSVMRQVQVASSYTALLNPLVISLFALVPHTTISTVTCIMGAIGLVNTVIMGANLFQNSPGWMQKLKSGVFVLVSLVLFGWEMICALQLFLSPGNADAFSSLTTLLVIIYLYGIARAWDLIGVRQFHIQEMVTPLLPPKMEEILSGKSHAERDEDASRQNP